MTMSKTMTIIIATTTTIITIVPTYYHTMNYNTPITKYSVLFTSIH